jgi:hypothetical protein
MGFLSTAATERFEKATLWHVLFPMAVQIFRSEIPIIQKYMENT